MNFIIYSKTKRSEYFLVPICGHNALVRKGISSNPHIHPVYHIMFALEGDGYVDGSCGKFYLKEKDIFIIHPNEKHIFTSYCDKSFTYFSFNFYLLPLEHYKKLSTYENFGTRENINRIESVAETRRLDDLFDFRINDIFFDYDKTKWGKIESLINLYSETTRQFSNKLLYNFGSSGHDEDLEWSNCFLKFFWDFYSIILHDKNEGMWNDKDKVLLNQIHNFLIQTVHEKYNLAALSEKLKYNPVYLCQYFKSKTGYTISQYFNKIKITKACEYLRTTNKTITEIAHLLNFYSSNHLSRNFKLEKKMSPKDYRRQLEAE